MKNFKGFLGISFWRQIFAKFAVLSIEADRPAFAPKAVGATAGRRGLLRGLTRKAGKIFMFTSKPKKFFAIAVVLAMTIFTVPQLTTADVSQSTIDYLKSQPPSAWTTMALAAAGQTNIPTDHLKTVSGNTVNDYAKTILALAALNLNPSTFGNVDYVAQLKSLQQGNQLGDPGLLNDDFWGLLALAAAGEPKDSAAITNAKIFILAQQNADGGFSWGVGQGSDTNDTAAAILALVEAGQAVDSTPVVRALNYLKPMQNADGGFSWDGQSESDTNSTAWIVWAARKVGQNPENWQKEGRTPITFLEARKNPDGSFGWKASAPTANLGATIDAVIALSRAMMPILPVQQTYRLRIEGKNETLCDQNVAGANALDLVKNGAAVCNYTYQITQESWGPYLRSINDEMAAGLAGWLGFLNYLGFEKSADQYVLKTGDEVLFYYGEWGWLPLKLTMSSQIIDSGQEILATVKSFDGLTWQPVAEAMLRGGDRDYVTAEDGSVSLRLPDGYWTLQAVRAGFVRSNRETVRVGQGIARTVGLQVEIDQAGRGQVGGAALIFEVTPSQLNFGKLRPGQQNAQTVTLANQGSVNFKVAAQVTGDQLFTDNLQLDGARWANFLIDLNTGTNHEIQVGLTVPNSYTGAGIKTGELIFWATTR